METVDTMEWVIMELDGDEAVLERLPDGGERRVRRTFLPEGTRAGDRFRVVAQIERRCDVDVTPLPSAVAEAVEDLTRL